MSGWLEEKRARNQLQEVKWLFINNNKRNKQKQPCRGKKTDKLDKARLDKAGLDKAGHKTYDDPTYGNEPTRNCKHKEIIQGANEEGNEEEQLGKINQ